MIGDSTLLEFPRNNNYLMDSRKLKSPDSPSMAIVKVALVCPVPSILIVIGWLMQPWYDSLTSSTMDTRVWYELSISKPSGCSVTLFISEPSRRGLRTKFTITSRWRWPSFSFSATNSRASCFTLQGSLKIIVSQGCFKVSLNTQLSQENPSPTCIVGFSSSSPNSEL